MTAVIAQFGEAWPGKSYRGEAWRVSIYRADGALDHRAWFGSEIAAQSYAEAYTT